MLEPPVIVHAGHMFLPDIDLPWPAKLLMMCVCLGPLVVFFAVRRGRTFKAVLVYLGGSCVAVFGANMLTWGWPTGREYAKGYVSWSWWWWETYPALVIGGTLLIVALGAGYLSRRLWRPTTRAGSATPN